ncbi:MAG: Smr/MutS family protein [Desulfobacteraceae bacterium]
MKPIVVPIDGTLDLHTFNPKELPSLLADYLDACLEKGIFRVRIIHGKGRGVQRARVHALLKKNPLVKQFATAREEFGGWGATMVELTSSKDQ